MVWLPWMLGGAAAAFGLKSLGEQTCDPGDVLSKIKNLLNAKTTFDQVLGNAYLSGQITDPVFYARATNLVAAINNSPVMALAMASTIPFDTTSACQAQNEAAALSQQLVDLSNEFSRMTGMSPPVPVPPVVGTPMSTGSLLTLALLVGGGYLVYRYMTKGEFIPKKLLPRYAGGSREEE